MINGNMFDLLNPQYSHEQLQYEHNSYHFRRGLAFWPPRRHDAEGKLKSKENNGDKM